MVDAGEDTTAHLSPICKPHIWFSWLTSESASATWTKKGMLVAGLSSLLLNYSYSFFIASDDWGRLLSACPAVLLLLNKNSLKKVINYKKILTLHYWLYGADKTTGSTLFPISFSSLWAYLSVVVSSCLVAYSNYVMSRYLKEEYLCLIWGPWFTADWHGVDVWDCICVLLNLCFWLTCWAGMCCEPY